MPRPLNGAKGQFCGGSLALYLHSFQEANSCCQACVADAFTSLAISPASL